MLNFLTPPFRHDFTTSVASTATDVATTARAPSRWLAYAFVGAMSLTQAGAVVWNIHDASRDLAEVPWGDVGAERPSLALGITQVSTGHIDLAAYAMGRDVGGLRFQPEQDEPWLEITFTNVSSACGTCT